ncbi:16S rRNA (uracil(1498)-N(3))-methyltransferase [Ramlibacter aurantiacus]|uniref:16S rRNA (uracil(1498)-N(3))-methyltransferase n=1 Tax=Ramlibacter aurantiacus TaxID=2801330 RepID=UPI001F214F51|nr:16S rRNA (uracil(1498)-N(3))-methyltransferase [Ramlibacter aurantiacus]
MAGSKAGPRFFCPWPLAEGACLQLPPGAARHVQVLRLQPGACVTLFDGQGGEWAATITRMGRSEVDAQVAAHLPIEREAGRTVHLAPCLAAGERMDWLVEKATELGAASFAPVLSERSVLRPSGERASRKQSHWQAVAQAACEQCGRNRVPAVEPIQAFDAWIDSALPAARRLVLSLDPQARPIGQLIDDDEPALLLSGPEGGLSPKELQAAHAGGFEPVSLGPRVLRAETAPLAALAILQSRAAHR